MSEKELWISAAVFVVLYLALSAAVIYLAARRRTGKEKKQIFDERQVAAQGSAYKAAFWTMLCYYMLYAIVSGAAEIVWCDPFLGAFLGVIIGVTVFAIICIFRDAYFRPDQSAASAIVLINLICLCQGVLGVVHLSEGNLIENGVLSADSLQFFIVLMGLTIDAAILVKHQMEKREERG